MAIFGLVCEREILAGHRTRRMARAARSRTRRVDCTCIRCFRPTLKHPKSTLTFERTIQILSIENTFQGKHIVIVNIYPRCEGEIEKKDEYSSDFVDCELRWICQQNFETTRNVVLSEVTLASLWGQSISLSSFDMVEVQFETFNTPVLCCVCSLYAVNYARANQLYKLNYNYIYRFNELK